MVTRWVVLKRKPPLTCQVRIQIDTDSMSCAVGIYRIRLWTFETVMTKLTSSKRFLVFIIIPLVRIDHS